jgi:hypothetical protein
VPSVENSVLDDVQVLTEFNREDEPKLSFHLKGGVFQGKNLKLPENTDKLY